MNRKCPRPEGEWHTAGAGDPPAFAPWVYPGTSQAHTGGSQAGLGEHTGLALGRTGKEPENLLHSPPRAEGAWTSLSRLVLSHWVQGCWVPEGQRVCGQEWACPCGLQCTCWKWRPPLASARPHWVLLTAPVNCASSPLPVHPCTRSTCYFDTSYTCWRLPFTRKQGCMLTGNFRRTRKKWI